MINVRYFAGLREELGKATDLVEATDCRTVADIWWLTTGRKKIPTNVLCAVNLEYVPNSYRVKDGDEVAFFPPVTGG
jgi:molybdopterin synthase sulfur carrier subunit